MEKIPDRQGGGIPLPEPLEEGSGVVGEARPLPGAGVRDHYPAFSVRIIFDQCGSSGQCTRPGPLPRRLGVIPA